MTAYSAGHWTDFGVAVAGSAATLAGLLFVAVSINLERVLSFPSLPARAGQTLILFTTPLIAALCLLVPGQADVALGCEFLVLGVLVGGFQVRLDARSVRAEQETPVTWVVSRVFPAIVSCGCIVVAGATLLARAGGGLYWLVPGALAGIVFGVINAWVLLVEIQR
ncbi:MAG TPA: hypothetical protein VMI33_26450 [Streptosporangiaceae bacterium]|nr:hypothetical protein [Streptosporangiaceae bacterium]